MSAATSMRPGVAARVVPPREIADSVAQAGAMFGAISEHAVAYEIIVDSDGPSWWVRAPDERTLERALARVLGAWPGATIARDAADPGRVHDFEQCVRVPLVPGRDPALPLRDTWRERAAREELDPLEGVIAPVRRTPGLRVLSRLTVQRAPARETRAIRERSEDRMSARDERREAARSSARPGSSPGTTAHIELFLLLGVALFGAIAWYVWTRIEWWHIALALVCALLLGAGLGCLLIVERALVASLLAHLPFGRASPLPETTVAEKLEYPLLEASLSVYATAPSAVPAAQVGDAAVAVADGYRSFFGGMGGGDLEAGAEDGQRPGSPEVRNGRERLLLNAREAGAIWHLPVRMAGGAGVERERAAQLPPLPRIARRGVLVGYTDGEREVRQSPELLQRHQLLVAKTRRGKSTMLRHIVAGLLERHGADMPGGEPAIVVVDPHQDLAEAVLDAVPSGLAGRTTYLDFANRERVLGLNLIDVHAFPDRDLQVEHIVQMFKSVWPANWGARMEPLFRNALLALLTVNRQRPPHAQYTLLDVLPLVVDPFFRDSITAQANDPAQSLYWRYSYNNLTKNMQEQVSTPVTSKIARFIASGPARAVFGQARTTFDPGRVVRDGGVLVVNTATGSLGEGAASLIGASLINLLTLRIEQQIALPPERRRRVIMVIDESSTLASIDYTRTLSELPKFGASLVMATQTLSKFDAIDEQLTRSIFANLDGLTAFQLSAEDARRIEEELGGGIAVADLVALDDYHAYASWWESGQKGPAFRFVVAPPPRNGDSARRREIAERSARRFGRPRAEVELQIMQALRGHQRREASSSTASELRASVDEMERTRKKPAARDAAPDAPLPRTRGGRDRGGGAAGKGKRTGKRRNSDAQQQLFPFDSASDA